MATTMNPAIAGNYSEKRTSLITTFLNWCANQEPNRLLWTGVALAVHGCILTPITVMVIALTGVNMILLTVSIVAMAFVLVTNLAALPAKVTVPTFLLSII